MFRLFLLFSCFILTFEANAQNGSLKEIQNADADQNSSLVLELARQLKNTSLTDSERIEVLNLEASHALFLEKFERSEEAYKLLIKQWQSPSEEQIQAMLDLGYLYQIKGESENSKKQYDQALAISH